MSDNNENMINNRFHNFEKNKYFYGKLMTVKDFEAEQQYFDEKRYLINSLLHGTGIVCGFTDTIVKLENDSSLKITFNDGGVALTWCGHEIVVQSNKSKQIINEKGELIKDLNDFPRYIYLKYKSRPDGYISVASNSSTCDEKYCPSRIVDDFDVVALNKPNSETACNNGSSLGKWLNGLEIKHRTCPECENNLSNAVFLGIIKTKGSDLQIEVADKNRIFFTPKELYQLLKCHAESFDSHVSNFDNPHKVKAFQTGALVSINDVTNPGGNINLLSSGSIEIHPNNWENSITIKEEHSKDTNNPHKVKAFQIGALVSLDGVSNPGGDIDLIEGKNIKITPEKNAIKIDCTLDLDAEPAQAEPKSIGTNNVVGTSTRYAREDHEHKLEEYSVDYTRLSGDIQGQLDVLSMYLRERALKCSVTTFRKVGEEFRSEKKALEISSRFKHAVKERMYEKESSFIHFVKDMVGHIKELKEELKTQTERRSFNDFDDALKDLELTIEGDIPLKVASQLDEVCFFAMELKKNVNNPMFDALNCTVGSFRKVSQVFKNEIANTISLNFETAVNNKFYESEEKFVDFMKEKFHLLKDLQDEIKDSATEESLKNYVSSVNNLGSVIMQHHDHGIAAAQEEVCSAANKLEPVSQNLMYEALKCTEESFKEVYKRLDSDVANRISEEFEKALKNKVYDNKSEFIQFMEKNLEFLNMLPDEVKYNAVKKDFDNYVAVVKELTDTISSKDADKIAAKLKELCYFARELRPANSIYRALRCTAVNFYELADNFENKIANEISVKFDRAVDNELYENENEFIDFIKANFELFEAFGRSIIDMTTRPTFHKYITDVHKLKDILESNNALEIAKLQEEICSSAKGLEVHSPA